MQADFERQKKNKDEGPDEVIIAMFEQNLLSSRDFCTSVAF